jgi:hypothetical protein
MPQNQHMLARADAEGIDLESIDTAARGDISWKLLEVREAPIPCNIYYYTRT